MATATGRMRILDEAPESAMERTTLHTALGTPDGLALAKQVEYWRGLAMRTVQTARAQNDATLAALSLAQAVRGSLLETMHGIAPERAIESVTSIRPDTIITLRLPAKTLQTMLSLIH